MQTPNGSRGAGNSRALIRPSTPFLTLALAATVALGLPGAAMAGERGHFGFSLAVDTEGFSFNPTLRSLKVTQVVPASPAAQAGMKAGDEIVEIAGHAVAGSKAREMQALAAKDAGQSLNLKVRHPEGDVVALTMVAAAEKPAAK